MKMGASTSSNSFLLDDSESTKTSSTTTTVKSVDLIIANLSSSSKSPSASRGRGSDFESGDVAWILACAALVWLMVPGIGFFYSGMSRSKSALSLIILCCWSIAVVSVQWFIIGYSLTFSSKGSFLIGNVDKMFLIGVTDGLALDTVKIPEILFSIYHGMIAGITPALVIGATAERGRFLPTIVFMILWSTFVYDFLAYWTWNPNGWSYKLGGLDFAGGMPVHIAAGAAAAAFAIILGEREGRRSNVVDYKPHNLVQVVLGTSLMWFGWFGFNGGSALGANARTAMVLVVTNLSASIGGITWAMLDYQRNKTFSALSFCFGAVAGLVCITPAAGYVRPASAIVFGILGALCCRMAIDLKDRVEIDDALDVVAVHGVGGLVGTLLTGIFAEKAFCELDGHTKLEGGALDGNWWLILDQSADCVAGIAWSFLVTFGILWGMNKIPGLRLRVDAHTASQGMDKVEMGECAYERISMDKVEMD